MDSGRNSRQPTLVVSRTPLRISFTGGGTDLAAFYERDHEGMPKRWLQIVKQSIRTVLPRFSARRMVKEYVRDMYVPAMREAVTK